MDTANLGEWSEYIYIINDVSKNHDTNLKVGNLEWIIVKKDEQVEYTSSGKIYQWMKSINSEFVARIENLEKSIKQEN